MTFERLFDILPMYLEKYPEKETALAGKVDGKWKTYSIQDYTQIVNNLSYGLIHSGVKKGDKIATISPNRPEWNIIDMAILQIGAIHVPIYPTISENDYRYILSHSEVKYIFVSGWELYRKIKHIVPNIATVKGVYTFKHFDDVPHLQELVKLGKENQEPEKLDEIKSGIKEEEVATIIYTSGTTGDPKGVMLSHKNILSNVMNLYHIFPVDETSRAVSYLPLCHVYERTNIYILLYLGVSLYYPGVKQKVNICTFVHIGKPHVT
jgi:long-chain acyl-CoA synthetase